jgi:hypothetical protein
MIDNATVIGTDTETFLIGKDAIFPKIVCLSAALRGPASEWNLLLVSDGDSDFDAQIRNLFSGENKEAIKVFCKAPYDLQVIGKCCPRLIPAIFAQVAEGKVSDLILREKLLVLATNGDLEWRTLPDGSRAPRKYHLADMARDYLGKDLSKVKNDPDAWRLNYHLLSGMSVSKWPQDAIDYAVEDAKLNVEIYELQERRRQEIIAERDHDPFKVETFRMMVSYALSFLTDRGMAVDPVEKRLIEELLAEELAPEKMNLLIEKGILEPATPPRPAKRGVKAHRPDCADPKTCDCPPKMVAGKDEKVTATALKKYVEALAKDNPEVTLKYTEPTDKFPEGQLSVDAAWLEDHWHLDPLLEQFYDRQKLQKLVTTEIPRMNWKDAEGKSVTAEVVHPCYDPLKATGRTSSYAQKLFPSFNCQNVDPRARGCYVPRPGHLLFSIDYSQMELGTAAQTCLSLFGKSVLADKINAKVDPHAYLGSQLAAKLDSDFRELLADAEIFEPDAVFGAFQDCKESGIKIATPDGPKDFYKHYRTFAKPTGLGYPGGLGPETFRKYAKATYGIVVDLETATVLRQTWRETFPEFVAYHKYINDSCADPFNDGKYRYTSPGGMLRSGCDYCAAANGMALQTPSAEGALYGVWDTVRACFDPSWLGTLYGKAWPICFIHDEIVGEVLDNAEAHDIVYSIADLMVNAMRLITPDVRAAAQPVLMRRWSKDAEPMFDSNKKLIPWEPKT